MELMNKFQLEDSILLHALQGNKITQAVYDHSTAILDMFQENGRPSIDVIEGGLDIYSNNGTIITLLNEGKAVVDETIIDFDDSKVHSEIASYVKITMLAN